MQTGDLRRPVEVAEEDIDRGVGRPGRAFGTLVGRTAAQDRRLRLHRSVRRRRRWDIPDGRAGPVHEIGTGKADRGSRRRHRRPGEGESKTFTSPRWWPVITPAKEADVTVTVKSIKERELPDADDDFAQLAEFDTLAELRADLTEQVRRVKPSHQAEKIRDNALEPCWRGRRSASGEHRQKPRSRPAARAIHGLDHDEAKFDGPWKARAARGRSSTPTRDAAEKAVKTQLLMDAVADEADISPGERPHRAAGADVAPVRHPAPAAGGPASRTISCRRCSPTCARLAVAAVVGRPPSPTPTGPSSTASSSAPSRRRRRDESDGRGAE